MREDSRARKSGSGAHAPVHPALLCRMSQNSAHTLVKVGGNSASFSGPQLNKDKCPTSSATQPWLLKPHTLCMARCLVPSHTSLYSVERRRKASTRTDRARAGTPLGLLGVHLDETHSSTTFEGQAEDEQAERRNKYPDLCLCLFLHTPTSVLAVPYSVVFLKALH